jgi:hypothetical protein
VLNLSVPVIQETGVWSLAIQQSAIGPIVDLVYLYRPWTAFNKEKQPPKSKCMEGSEDHLPQTIHQFGSQRSTEVTRGAYDSPECPLQITGDMDTFLKIRL